MRRRQFLLTAALALAASFAGHALYGALVSPQAVQARAASGQSDDGSWEYCAVVKAQYPGAVRNVYWIAYFTSDGVKTENVEAALGGSPFRKAVNKLGRDGWEMVGSGPLEIQLEARPNPLNSPSAVFFKRRRG